MVSLVNYQKMEREILQCERELEYIKMAALKVIWEGGLGRKRTLVMRRGWILFVRWHIDMSKFSLKVGCNITWEIKGLCAQEQWLKWLCLNKVMIGGGVWRVSFIGIILLCPWWTKSMVIWSLVTQRGFGHNSKVSDNSWYIALLLLQCTLELVYIEDYW